ncbi:MAG TPA: type II toxin-antitoxin system HicB family antitoxin [Thermomicrobiales bacterium]|jgi:predicted RNase H-like HicB family nuclease
MTEYPIEIFWSGEVEAYIADVPDLKYCSAHGPTPEAALREVRLAMAAWLETARELGEPIPLPTMRPTLIARAS